jgi:hypothetical protein
MVGTVVMIGPAEYTHGTMSVVLPEKLERALQAFRRDQAMAYLHRLSGGAANQAPAQRARAFLCSEAAFEAIAAGHASGELAGAAYAALCAHVARAHAETRYGEARARSLELPDRPLQVEGELRPIGVLSGDWLHERSAARRARLLAALDAPLAEHALALVRARLRADQAAGNALARLAPERHPDAGPAGGSAQLAERWLGLTEDLAREAFAAARRLFSVEGEGGLDNLWAVTGQALGGLFPPAGRYRRLAAELAPLGLRTQLARAGRLVPPHPGPFAAPQLLLPAIPRDVRIAPSRLELGLGSELLAAEALGRALAHVHAAPALPFALRHPSAASVARAAGGLLALRFAEPRFLRKRREQSQREAGDLARLAAGFALADGRLAAAAVLARDLDPERALEAAQPLCERALGGQVPPGCALALLVRISAGSAFRGKLWAPALVYALRERFDEDWYENPRAAEPLRGAFARAGDFSVEAFAEELGAQIERGPGKLSELF